MRPLTIFLSTLSLLLSLSLTHAQTLENYLKIAEENNPEIQAFELNYRLAQEKIEASTSLSNLDLGFGYFVSEPETRTGAQKSRFAVTQMLPWFGTLSARKRYATSLAESEFISFSIAKRKLALSVAQSYYLLYGLQAKSHVIDEQIRWIGVNKELLLKAVEAGTSSLSELLRLEVQLNDLKQQKLTIDQQLTAEIKAFYNLLNTDGSPELVIVEELPLPFIELPETPDFSVHPELLKFDSWYTSITEAEQLNQKDKRPNLALGMDYITVQERLDQTFEDNGKDIFMPRLSLSIPVFSKKYTSASVQNNIKKEQIEAKKDQRLNDLENLYARALAQLNAARLGFELQGESLERLHETETLYRTRYMAGNIDFESLLEVQELKLNVQMRRIDATVQCYQQYALINYLINP